MMGHRLPLAVLVAVLGIASAQTPESSKAFVPGELNPNAPSETELLGQLTGIWDIEQEIRNRDGSWGETRRAEWHWYYVLDGHAIQDDWIQPPLSAGDVENRNFGTNLRIYDTETQTWDMAWIDSTNRGLSSFTATNEDGTVVMVGENPSGRPVRNRFFDMTRDTFEWVQEWTFDDGATWVPVTQIHATRRD